MFGQHLRGARSTEHDVNGINRASSYDELIQASTRDNQAHNARNSLRDRTFDGLDKKWGEGTAMDRAVLNNPSVIVLISILLRCCVGLHYSDSGALDQGMDEIETQRKLLKMTTTKPLGQWYQTSDNGTEAYPYPPLSGYSSWFLGNLAMELMPGFISDDLGYDKEGLREFLRACLLFCDLLFFSSTWFFCIVYYWSKLRRSREFDIRSNEYLSDIRFFRYTTSGSSQRYRKARSAFSEGLKSSAPAPRVVDIQSEPLYTPAAMIGEIYMLILLQPGFLLVDHGFFQQNMVVLGMIVWALYFCLKGSVAGAVLCFCISVGYNRLALSYSGPLFIVFFWSGIKNSNISISNLQSSRQNFLGIAAAILIVFVVSAIVWSPFCIYHAIGPKFLGSRFSLRSCSEDILVGLKVFADQDLLVGAIGAMPCCYDLLRQSPNPPSVRRLLWALFNSSIAFCLLSSEPNSSAILFPLLPVALLAGEIPGPSCWFSLFAVYCLLPRLFSSNLLIPSVMTTGIYLGTNLICFREKLFVWPGLNDSKSKPLYKNHMLWRRLRDWDFFYESRLQMISLLLIISTITVMLSYGFGSHIYHGSVRLILLAALAYGNFSQWNLPGEQEDSKQNMDDLK